MDSLEAMRLDMIAAFHAYAKEKPLRRDFLWNNYVKAREEYLRLACKIEGRKYAPIGTIPNEELH